MKSTNSIELLLSHIGMYKQDMLSLNFNVNRDSVCEIYIRNKGRIVKVNADLETEQCVIELVSRDLYKSYISKMECTLSRLNLSIQVLFGSLEKLEVSEDG